MTTINQHKSNLRSSTQFQCVNRAERVLLIEDALSRGVEGLLVFRASPKS